MPCEGLCPCSPYCPAWVVGGCGRPAKDGLGLPAFPYCPARVVGGCGRPARDRKDTSCGKLRCSCLPGGLYWLPVAKVATSVVPPGSRASALMNNFMFAMSLALWLWDQLAYELVVFTARRDLAVTNAVRVGPLGSGEVKSN